MVMLAVLVSCAKEDGFMRPNANDSLRLADFREQALGSKKLDEAVGYAMKELNLAQDLHYPEDEVKALLLLYELYYNCGKNVEALAYATKASQISDSLGFRRLSAQSYHALGNVMSRFKNNPVATKNFAQAFMSYFEMEDTIAVTDVWRDLMPSYFNANIFDSAMIVCQRSYYFDRRFHNERGMTETKAQHGSMFLAIFRTNAVDPDYSKLDSAHILLREAEAINRKLNDPKIRKIVCIGLAETLYYLSVDAKDPKRSRELADSSMLYLPEACFIAKNTGVAEIIHRINILGVKIKHAVGDVKATELFVDSLVRVADSTKTYIDKETAYRAKSILAAYNDDYENAFANRVLAEKNREVINYRDNSVRLSIQLAKKQNDDFLAISKRKQDELIGESEFQKNVSMMAIGGVTLLLIIGALLFRSFNHTKRLNNKINSINEEIRAQSEVIRVKNEEIMDGITYASIIQFAAMPSASEMKHLFGDHLVYLSARNVVSGDFYWASEDISGRYKLLAVGDCTGHGVPGALLSMLGMSILDYTTRHFGSGEISAGVVLDKMRNNFKRTLNQTSFSNDKSVDSIDIVLLVFDTQAKVLHYSAAFRPLLLFRYGELMRMKADSMPIGIYLREKPHFTDNEMKLCKGDIIYLYSDGMTDQEGYEDADAQAPKAYSTKKFFKLLKGIFQQPFDEQETIIRQSIEEWRLPKAPHQIERDKTDDATIVGVAVNNFIKFDEV